MCEVRVTEQLLQEVVEARFLSEVSRGEIQSTTLLLMQGKSNQMQSLLQLRF